MDLLSIIVFHQFRLIAAIDTTLKVCAGFRATADAAFYITERELGGRRFVHGR